MNFILLSLFIRTITCFLEGPFVVILILSLGLLLSLIIFWMLLILFALRLEKASLILKTFLVVFLDFDAWEYDLPLLLFSLAELVILKYFYISLTSLGNLAGIDSRNLLTLVGLFVFLFPFFTSIDWIYLRSKFQQYFLSKCQVQFIPEVKVHKNGLRDMWTYGMTLASAYVLCCLFAVWSQLQMIGRSLRWEWVMIGVLLLNTKDWVQ